MAEHFIHSDPFSGRITAVKLHRLALLPLEMIAYQSLCNKLWTIYHVDYVTICRLNATNYAKAGDLFLYSMILLAVWTCSFLYCIIGKESTFIPIFYTPLVLYVFLLVNLFQPFNCALPYTRRWLQIRLGKWLTAACSPPTFIDSYVSDHLTSLHQVFMDLVFLMEVYITKGNLKAIHEGFYLTMQGIAMCLPEWVRAIQCLKFYNITGDPRQLLNIVKYLFITSVAISKSFLIYNQHHSTTYFINPFFTIWICCVLVRSTLCCYWDLTADCGLFTYNDLGQFTLLREVIVYPKQLYYFFIIENIILRYFWMMHIIVHKTGFISPTALEWLGPVAEVFRRFVWSLIRIEKKNVDIILGLRTLHDVELDVPTEHYSRALKRLQASMRFKYEETKNKIVPLMVNVTSLFRRPFRDESPMYQYKSVNQTMPFTINRFDEDDDEDMLLPQKTWIQSPVLNPLWIQEK